MLIGKINSGNLGFKGIYDPNVLITGSSGYIGNVIWSPNLQMTGLIV